MPTAKELQATLTPPKSTQKYLLKVVLIDAKTGTIKVLRLLTFTL